MSFANFIKRERFLSMNTEHYTFVYVVKSYIQYDNDRDINKMMWRYNAVCKLKIKTRFYILCDVIYFVKIQLWFCTSELFSVSKEFYCLFLKPENNSNMYV